MKKRKTLSKMICFIMAFALLLPGSFINGRTKAVEAAETGSEQPVDESIHGTADDILGLNAKVPDEYDSYSKIDVYNSKINGKGAPFLLSEQNELFLYRTSGKAGESGSTANGWYWENCDMTLRSSRPKDGEYIVDSINNYNSNTKKVANGKVQTTEHKVNVEAGYSYVQGIGFDPLGSGRKQYSGYVGVKDYNLYCFVVDPLKGTTWSVNISEMSWLAGVKDPLYYEVGNYISITAGDYNGDGKDTLLVYGCGTTYNTAIYEVSFNGSKLTSTKILDLTGNSSSNEPILYNKCYTNGYKSGDSKLLRHRVQVTLTTGDFDGDDIDEYAFTAGFGNTSDGAKNGYSGKSDNVEQYATTVGIVDCKNGKWSAPATFYMYDRIGDPSLKNGKETWKLQIMHNGSLTAADTDGDGVDEIVVAGYTSYTDSKNPCQGTFSIQKVKSGKQTVNKYVLESISHVYDMDKSNYVSCIIRGTTSGNKTTYSRTDLEKMPMPTLQAKYMDNKEDEAFVFAHLAMAGAHTNGTNAPEDVFVAGTIYSYEGNSAQKVFSPKIMTQSFTTVMDYNSSTKCYVFWVNNVAVGNFDHNDGGREQFVYTLWFKKAPGKKDKVQDPNYVYMGIVGGSKYDDTYDADGVISSFGTCKQYAYSDIRAHYKEVLWSSTGNASGVLSNVDGRYCNAVPVSVDINNDGLKAKFSGAYYAYTDPEVVAVLEAAPYFAECQDAGSITYTVTNGYGRSKSEGWEVSYNVGFAGEFGIKTGGPKLGIEFGYTGGVSKTFTKSYTVSESTSITATDKTSVIVSRIPVMLYVYDIENPNTNKWEKAAHTVTVPLTPVMFSMSVDEYNELVDKYNNAIFEKEREIDAKIKNNQQLTESEKKFISDDKPLLENINEDGTDLPADHEGDPFNYTKKMFNKSNELSSTVAINKNNGSTGVEWDFEQSQEEEFTHTHGFYVSVTLQWGASIGVDSWAGFNVGMEATWSFTDVKSSFTGTTISVEIPDLNPDTMRSLGYTDDQIKGYGFKWQLGQWSKKLNGSTRPEVPIYGFYTTAVTAPIKAVDDLEAEMCSDEGERYVQLTWTNPSTTTRPIDSFTVYRITEEEKKNGKKTEIVTVRTELDTVSDTEYVFKGVGKDSSYSFVVVSNNTLKDENGKKVKRTSPDSNMATASYQDKMIYDIMKKSEIADKDKEGAGTDAKTSDKTSVSSGSGDEDALVIFYNDGSTKEITGATGSGGQDGKSAYEIAVENGFSGDVNAWLASLKGAKGDSGSNGTGTQGNPGKDGTDGKNGKSAYEIARDGGYTGTEAEWLESLKGTDGTNGKSAFEIANEVAAANGGTVYETEAEWIESLQGLPGTAAERGDDGKSAYEIAMNGKNPGDAGYLTEAEWIASLKGDEGEDGADGKSAYEIAMNGKNPGDAGYLTEAEWIASLKGDKGDDGANGKSAYEIAMTGKQEGDIGYYATEGAWITSLKGEQGESGISIEPCYMNEDGIFLVGCIFVLSDGSKFYFSSDYFGYVTNQGNVVFGSQGFEDAYPNLQNHP